MYCGVIRTGGYADISFAFVYIRLRYHWLCFWLLLSVSVCDHTMSSWFASLSEMKKHGMNTDPVFC